MFASIRRYRLTRGAMDELARRIDQSFAEEIRTQPGFKSYEFIDCGDNEIMTISLFGQAHQAEASRELAERWTAENLGDLGLARIEALDGRIWVSRADPDMLEAAHSTMVGKFAAIRRYRLRSGEVSGLMHIVDDVFVNQIRTMEGFEAYHALDCGRGEILSISVFRDQPTAEASDDLALQFVREHLNSFDIERTEVIGGKVRVSRALVEVLASAHA
jgi:heme-degrading monooxygenase HmoA